MKKVFVIFLSIILIISLTACGKNDFEAFINASNKTSNIKKGQEDLTLNLNLDFNTEGLSSEQLKELNYFKSIEARFNTAYDKELEKTISRTYFNFGGLGFDVNFYDNGEKSFIKMPIIGDYMLIDEELKGNFTQDMEAEGAEGEFISEEAFKAIKDKWLNIIKRDDVFAGKDSVMTTPDGEVKITEYSIKLTDEDFKTFLNESIDIIMDDKNLKENITKYIKLDNEGKEEINIQEFFDSFEKSLEQSKIKNLKYKAYIDIDGYIIKEVLDFHIKFEDMSMNRMKELKYSFEINRWSIEKEQKLEFPELTEENILDPEEVDQGVPFIFENVLEKE